MNDRIRKLCSQAISDVDGIQNPDTQDMYIPDCFAEKFAELIIRESIEVMIKNDYHGEWLGEKVKEHFGVE